MVREFVQRDEQFGRITLNENIVKVFHVRRFELFGHRGYVIFLRFHDFYALVLVQFVGIAKHGNDFGKQRP